MMEKMERVGRRDVETGECATNFWVMRESVGLGVNDWGEAVEREPFFLWGRVSSKEVSSLGTG